MKSYSKSIFIVMATIVALGIFSYSTPAHAVSRGGKIEKVFDNVIVAGTGTTVTSRAFNINSISRMGYYLGLTRGTKVGPTANIRLTIEGSYIDTPSTVFATIQTIRQSWASTVATVETITTPPAMPWIRFVAEGGSTNATDTTVNMWVFTQE